MTSRVALSSRRALSTAARVEIDWSRQVWASTSESSAKYSKLRSWVASSEAMYEKYSTPPAPVDFAKTKSSVRDTGLVDMMESFYKTVSIPAEVHVFPPEEITAAEEHIQYCVEADACYKEMLPVLEKELDWAVDCRTTVDTTLFDYKINYPLIHEEVLDEIEERDWFKDTEFAK